MKLWTGIVTEKIAESKDFYTKLFGCQILFEEDWFVLLELGGAELGFMQPDLDFQAEIFQKPFNSEGVWITVDVEDATAEYQRMQQQDIKIAMELRDEPWGDRHFTVLDPSGIAVDIVQRITS